MKKIIIISILMAMFSGLCITVQAAENAEIKAAVVKYKNKNYLGCISDLKEYVKKDPANAAAWYYLGNAYMNVGITKDAHEAFEKVITLNTVPKLTSYAIQAKLCMETPVNCKYYDLNQKEIKQLKENPAAFLKQYEIEKNKPTKSTAEADIEQLIKSKGNIHPDAWEVIRNEQNNMRQQDKSNINNQKSSLEDSEKYAKAMEMIRHNTQMESLSMMLDMPQENNRYSYQDYLMNNYSNMSPEMVQAMMMNSMIPNL